MADFKRGPAPTASKPRCQACGEIMRWGELLRTWVCRYCGYFLDDVDAQTGEIGCGCENCARLRLRPPRRSSDAERCER